MVTPPLEHLASNQIALTNAMEELTKQLAKRQLENNTTAQAMPEELRIANKRTRPTGIFKKVAVGSTKAILLAPFQIASGILKTTTVASAFALGTYTGTGGDPIAIPCYTANWARWHFGYDNGLSNALDQLCSPTNLAPYDALKNLTPDGYYDPALPNTLPHPKENFSNEQPHPELGEPV